MQEGCTQVAESLSDIKKRYEDTSLVIFKVLLY
jgi:hypothetical protein